MESNIENKETVEINNKQYTVISKRSKDVFSKDRLIKLIANYAMAELQKES